jgi:hypothetical protein
MSGLAKSPTSILTTKRGEKEEKDAWFFAQAGLASYLCRLCTLCVHLSVLGGGIHPTTMDHMRQETSNHLRAPTRVCRRDRRVQTDEENLPEIEDVLSVCAGLVTVDEESDVIHLISAVS